MKKFCFFLLLTVSLQNTYAQPSHLSFDHLGIKEGLPDNSINGIIQDSQGYMWLTTYNGVVRYDGYKVKVYKPGIEDKSNVPSQLFNTIFLDKNHDIWVNSFNNGLFKYDRRADRFVQHKNKSNAKGEFSVVAGMDSTGKIWSVIAPNGFVFTGLRQFEPGTGKFKSYGPDQKGLHYINCKAIFAYIDHKGRIWAGTDNGLYRYDPLSDSFTGYFVSADTLKQKSIQMVYQAESMPGKLWVHTHDRKDKSHQLLLMDIQSGQVEEFNHRTGDKNSVANDTTNAALEDKKHRLWLGTNSGLSLYNDKTKTFTNYVPADTVHNKDKNRVYNIFKDDKDGNLWMASGDGLLCFNPETSTFNRYVHDKEDPSSINSSNGVTDILFDREGTLWVGFNNNAGGGADRVNTFKSAFEPIAANGHKFPWHDIFGVARTPDGFWWIAAQNGLYRYDRNNSAVKLVTPEWVYTVITAKTGLVYYNPADKSGVGVGLRVYDPKTGKTEQYRANAKDSASLSNNAINCILEDHNGMIWIGTQGGGICAFNPNTKRFTRYPYIVNNLTKVSHNVLDDNQAMWIYEDRAGALWAGTLLGGLNRLDRKRNTFISSFRPQYALSTIMSINQDNKGRLWAGTFVNGLFLVDKQTGAPVKRFTEKDGLLMDQGSSIHTDQSDFMWVESRRGFSRITTSDFSIKNYKAEGNSWESIFNENFYGIDIDNKMVIWGGDKMVIFDPKAVTQDVSPPLVHIQDIAYGDPQSAKDSSTSVETYGRTQIKLPWNENKISFNYVALDFINPAENKYAYQLEGYDNHWVQAGSQRSITYTNLSPGTYTFRVKAVNSDGVWSKKDDSFTLTILAPLWLRWWALVIYVILIITAIRAYIVYRSRKLLKDKRVLEETVQVRTAEVMEQKEEILQQKEELEAQAHEAAKQASVDRVRAEIASMRSTKDLERITPLIWSELKILDVPFTRCGVFIMDEEEAEIHTYLSTPDGKALASYPIPFNTEGFGKDILINWRKHQVYTDHWDEAQFRAYSKNLVEQGAVESQDKYLAALPTAGLDLHFVPFLQGMLYVGNVAPLTDDEMNTLQSLAEAFSTAYARYEDFNKLEAAKKQVDLTLTDLKSAQTQLIQTEKMASLGELTAGIAHEIQNPLNFVNNFSEVSIELLDEMQGELAKGDADEATALAVNIKGNLEKISLHGRRADAIVKNMLQHSRSSSEEKRPADVNALADEYMRLAYHGLRAKDKSFNALMHTDFDSTIGKVNMVQQDIGRVLINLYNNAFYAITEKKKQAGDGFEPALTLKTRKAGNMVVISVKDNGNGIPKKVLDKIYQPFFTTKPTGQGTGLGLSLSYDIVKAHGGELKVETVEGEFTEFSVSLPLNLIS